ncbi:hypothetical protein LZZ85_24370 [Terrimonas sp. NA20]|uniref:Uncharacterized protein n=1 Tax=Terrimonas ginsenosidimutans TaxID=2908004 RepID=A0ABS9KYQ9_9BACT|nr:hypothetical protein [Terrimonas ginsenosidimutans]MCG2617456.1 hypothetical protein [Terrimonas ginsenosidimutans]
MSVETMFKDIDDINNQFIEQDSTTLATIYRGNSGIYYLMPAVGPYGIKARKEVLDSILESGVIPIEENPPNPFVKAKNELKKIDENIQFYLSELNSKLDLAITMELLADESFYSIINTKVNALDGEDSYRTLFIPLGVVVGEIVRIRENGEWRLNKKYGYNPYFIPYITNGKGYFLPWTKLADMLLEKKFDIKKYFKEITKQKSFF